MDTTNRAAELLGLKFRSSDDPLGPTTWGFVSTFEPSEAHPRPKSQLMKVIREGFPVETVNHIIASGRLNSVEVDRVVMPRKTLANRKKVGALTAEQSGRLLRVARVIAAAEETFGNKEKAGAWLPRGTTALDGELPLDLLDTEEGAREVENLLTRIGHGIGA